MKEKLILTFKPCQETNWGFEVFALKVTNCYKGGLFLTIFVVLTKVYRRIYVKISQMGLTALTQGPLLFHCFHQISNHCSQGPVWVLSQAEWQTDIFITVITLEFREKLFVDRLTVRK